MGKDFFVYAYIKLADKKEKTLLILKPPQGDRLGCFDPNFKKVEHYPLDSLNFFVMYFVSLNIIND